MHPLHTAAVLPSGGCGLGGDVSPTMLDRQADRSNDCCGVETDVCGEDECSEAPAPASGCDGCNCPQRCCTGVNMVFLFQFLDGTLAVAVPTVSRHEISVENYSLLPHIDGLKRPSRSTTLALC